MDRRRFLQALTTLGGASTFPSFAVEKSSMAVASTAPVVPCENTKDLWPVAEAEGRRPEIGIVAIGSAGCSILTEQRANLPYLRRAIAMDSNPFGLCRTHADLKLQIGDGRTRYVEPSVMRFLANRQRKEIESAVAGLDMVFILAGVGGVTGTGVLPIVAEVTRDAEIPTIVATIAPFEFEGGRCLRIAAEGQRSVCRRVNASVSLSNQLFAQRTDDSTLIESVLREVPKAFTQLYRAIVTPSTESGLIGIDFEDVRVILSQASGLAAVGFGVASGKNCGENAVRIAVASPLLGPKLLQEASGVLVTIEGKPGILNMTEINNIMNIVKDVVCPEADLMFSALPSTKLDEDYSVTIFANGIPLA